MISNAMNMESTTERYKIVARYMDGVKVMGYHLVDSQGQHHKLAKDVVENMALEKLIINCSAQRYKDEIVIKGVKCKISDLPVIDASNGKVRGEDSAKKKSTIANQMSLIGRVTSGKNTIGYAVKTNSGEVKNLSRQLVINLAREGKISNARAQAYGSSLILRGQGFELTQLPILKTV